MQITSEEFCLFKHKKTWIMVGLDWQMSGKMAELEHVSFGFFHSGMDGFGLNFLKCGEGVGPVLSEGLFRAWLKPSSAFLAWICIEDVFLWPMNDVTEEGQLQGQWLRLQAVCGCMG